MPLPTVGEIWICFLHDLIFLDRLRLGLCWCLSKHDTCYGDPNRYRSGLIVGTNNIGKHESCEKPMDHHRPLFRLYSVIEFVSLGWNLRQFRSIVYTIMKGLKFRIKLRTVIRKVQQKMLYTYLPPVWPDWTFYWTLGKFLKHLAKINLPNSPTFKGNFCKDVKIHHFSF